MSFFDLIYDCAEFVVINKHPGVAVHKDDTDAGLVMQVSQELGAILYPVHRLDKVTSGAMLLAKSSEVASALGELFSSRQVQKYYLALSDRKPKKKQGAIKGGMEKARRGAWKLTDRPENTAITQFFSASVRPHLRMFLLKPLTGKTHQIRVALKSLSAPILGDKLYSGSESDRVYLHAWKISFTLDQKNYHFVAPAQLGGLFQLPELQNQLTLWENTDLLPWPK